MNVCDGFEPSEHLYNFSLMKEILILVDAKTLKS